MTTELQELAEEHVLAPTGAAVPVSPVTARCRELAEIEMEIRRRLRSNQRFLERFLDEDFIDDEDAGDDEVESEREEL